MGGIDGQAWQRVNKTVGGHQPEALSPLLEWTTMLDRLRWRLGFDLK